MAIGDDRPNGFVKSNGRRSWGVQRAHILVETKPGFAKKAERGISQLPTKGIISVKSLLGPYDIMVVAEKKNLEELGELIAEVQKVEGVDRTTTCLSVRMI